MASGRKLSVQLDRAPEGLSQQRRSSFNNSERPVGLSAGTGGGLTPKPLSAATSNRSINNLDAPSLSRSKNSSVQNLMSDVEKKLALAEKNLDTSMPGGGLLDTRKSHNNLLTPRISSDDLSKSQFRTSSNVNLMFDDGTDTENVVFLVPKSAMASSENIMKLNPEAEEKMNAMKAATLAKPSAKEVTDRLTNPKNFPTSYQEKSKSTMKLSASNSNLKLSSSSNNLSASKSSENLMRLSAKELPRVKVEDQTTSPHHQPNSSSSSSDKKTAPLKPTITFFDEFSK